MEYITNKIDLMLSIQGGRSSQLKLDEINHLNAVSCIAWYFKNSADWQPMAEMVNKQTDAQSIKLIPYFEALAGVRWNKDTLRFKRRGDVKLAGEMRESLATAESTKYWTYKAVKVEKPYDLEKVEASLAKAIAKKINEAIEHGQVLDIDHVIKEVNNLLKPALKAVA